MKLCILALGMVLFAFSASAGTTGGASTNFEHDPACVPHWVVVGSGSGFACHREGNYWVATQTSWLWYEDTQCEQGSRSQCSENYHPDYLYDSYDECCDDWGGCPVCACNQ